MLHRTEVVMFYLIQFLGKNQDAPDLKKYCDHLGTVELKNIEHLVYKDYSNEGICLLLNQDQNVSSIFLYSEGYENHKSFKGEMPNELDFHQSREEVRRRFSVLLQSGGGHIGILGRKIKIWDKFLWSRSHLIVQYADDLNSIELLTISVAEVLS